MDNLILTKDTLIINIVKHPVEGVNSWEWILIDTWKYDCTFKSAYHYKSEELARNAWKEFAEKNNIANWKWYSDKQSVQDIRTNSGTFI